MKKFLKRRWHSIPVALVSALLVLAIVAGGAFAYFEFKTLTTEIFVDEPLTIEYNLWGAYGGDSDWHPLGDDDSMTLERSAGDSFVMSLKVTNRADNALIVDTVFSGEIGWFTFANFPDSTSCPNGSTRFDNVTINVSGSAPAPATYTVTFTFTRE